MNRHGAPVSISRDEELAATQKRVSKFFLASSHIKFKPRPVRSHSNVVIAERNHGTIKKVLQKLQYDNTYAEDSTILSRATFLRNIFAGSHMQSSFELAIGFSPSVLGIPGRLVTEQIIVAHRDQKVTRALQGHMRSGPIRDAPPSNIIVGEPILYYYKSSKNNEKDEWKSGQIVNIERYYAIIQSDKTGRKSKVEYEDIRIKPKMDLRREIMQGPVDFYLTENT